MNNTRAHAWDIADYLICQDWRLFRDREKREVEPHQAKPKQYARARGSEDENKDIVCPFDIVKEPPSEKSEKVKTKQNIFFVPPQFLNVITDRNQNKIGMLIVFTLSL